MNENVIQNIIKYYGGNVNCSKSLNPLNLNFSRNISLKNLNINQCRSTPNKLLLPDNGITLKKDYSTQIQNLINKKKNINILQENSTHVEEYLNNNISVNNICFTTYNKRFMSSLHKLSNNNNNLINLKEKGNLGKGNMSFSTKTENTNNNNVKDTTTQTEHANDSQNQNNQSNTNKEKFTFSSLVKEYGIIAVVVYFVLSCTIYLTTLGVILYYDIDPDELTKKSKTYITKMVKRVLGKVETIEESIEEAKAKKNEKKKKKQDSQEQLIPVETDENGKPVEKKKRGFIKTMIMTFAVAQIFSPPKSLMTIIITPYIAKILKRGRL